MRTGTDQLWKGLSKTMGSLVLPLNGDGFSFHPSKTRLDLIVEKQNKSCDAHPLFSSEISRAQTGGRNFNLENIRKKEGASVLCTLIFL